MNLGQFKAGFRRTDDFSGAWESIFVKYHFWRHP